MNSPNPLKIAAVADFAASLYRSGDDSAFGPDDEENREKAALKLAADTVFPSQLHGVISPELRARLDAMTEDYAKILARIDQMAVEAEKKPKKLRNRKTTRSG